MLRMMFFEFGSAGFGSLRERWIRIPGVERSDPTPRPAFAVGDAGNKVGKQKVEELKV